MWSGTVKLGLVSFPVSIGKSWADDREKNLRDVCVTHKSFVERTERCHEDNAVAHNILTVLQSDQDYRQKMAHIESYASKLCDLSGGKAKGVEMPSGQIRVLNDAEFDAVSSEIASDVLEIVDYQPVYDLPLEFGTGTYYVRYNPPKKGSTSGLDAMANFVATLERNTTACVIMWKRSGSHKLCALHVGGDNLLLLTILPLATEYRDPGLLEKRHHGIEVDDESVNLFDQLLKATAADQFEWDSHASEANEKRSEAVDKILAEEDGGEQKEQKNDEEQEDKGQQVPDLMKALQESIKAQKKSGGKKEKA